MSEVISGLVEEAAEKLRIKSATLKPIGGRVLLDCGEQKILIDGTDNQIQVSVVGQAEADCRVRLKAQLLNDILDGRRKAFMAFATGKIGISGDMSVAIKLQPILSGN
mgnify:CR=1 FL=1